MITGQLTASHMSIADLERIARVHYPVTGDLSANISFDGSERNPAGHGSLTITNASAWNEPIATLALQFQGDGNSIRSTEQLRTGGGKFIGKHRLFAANRRIRCGRKYSGAGSRQVANRASTHQRNFREHFPGQPQAAEPSQNPQVDANLQIAQLQFHDQTIRLVQARLNVAQQHATFTLQSDLDQGALQAKGDADLTGEQMASASIDIRALPIGLLLANYLPRGGPQFRWANRDSRHPSWPVERTRAPRGARRYSHAHCGIQISRDQQRPSHSDRLSKWQCHAAACGNERQRHRPESPREPAD